MKVMEGNELANPVLGCYITALIRSILGEALHLTAPHAKILSATTDGFLTTRVNLETNLLKEPSKKRPLLNLFRRMREDLSGDPTAYEIKHEGMKIMS
jgi:hypothetical protein